MPEHAAHSAPITHADLLGRTWQYRRSDGPVFAERVRLISDGAVAGHDGAFEALWTLEDGIVTFHASNGVATTRFTEVTRHDNGRIVIAGDFMLAPELELRFILDSMRASATAPPAPQRLNVAMSLGGSLDALLVLFNSIGRPFDGRDTRWEFYDLPRCLALDHVRFAERVDPARWYVDQADTICAMLAPIIRCGYRRVVLSGLSSGGFASLMIGTMLSQRHPELAVDSFTINPQTGHAPAHRAVMAGLPPAIPPAVMDDATYTAYAGRGDEISELLEALPRTARLTHHVFYDHDNPAERYYVDLIRRFDQVVATPYRFGVGHMSGCLALMERGVVHDAIMDMLAADQAAACASSSVFKNR
ncbi:hypothetical protein [Acidiphilium rubrum]|uniref:Uncharacterized protein n=1 Tax=Acidiphilium rubrum TaxID=526 RepID=A0A8G2FCK4_ACIRU|nr:hypothetical protein [Acidiphilium rubrum]SIQ39750.1 hypothetical protein SAMN05421828_104106 [Acidiphilium rubrum]